MQLMSINGFRFLITVRMNSTSLKLEKSIGYGEKNENKNKKPPSILRPPTVLQEKPYSTIIILQQCYISQVKNLLRGNN